MTSNKYNIPFFTLMDKFLIVFDINDTVISKIRKSDKHLLNDTQLSEASSVSHYYLLKRPLTNILVQFLHNHNLKYIFWSTSMKHNIAKMIPFLENIGYKNHLGYLGQEECEEGKITQKIKAKQNIKNLQVVSRKYKVKLEHCVLVDNDKEKHIEGQNFIKVEDINLNGDNEIISLCKKLDIFVDCEEDCFVKKL